MSTQIALGLQWGDEGKGKIIDYLSRNVQLVVRAAGGANAGHTIIHNNKKYVLHLIPSGIVHNKPRCLMAGGMVIDPETLINEIELLENMGINVWDKIGLAYNAHLILPYHKIIEKIREKHNKIGTTLRGIGPAYETCASRYGIPAGLLTDKQKLKESVNKLYENLYPVLKLSDEQIPEPKNVIENLNKTGEKLLPILTNVSKEIFDYNDEGKNILLEGAQGALLDLKFGTYPYVTSSSTITGGIFSGTGTGPQNVQKVTGVAKAYTTRVGNGPFPTELQNDSGKKIAEKGAEFGSTTGRPRRCGWLDGVALRYGIRITGTTEIALTKVDVLSGFDKIKICTGYKLKSGEEINYFPENHLLLDSITPIYKEFDSWDINSGENLINIPENLKNYMDFIENFTKTPIKLLSYGPQREKTLVI
jgi:adenylosuccinate synthase